MKRATSCMMMCILMIISIFFGTLNFIPSVEAEQGAPHNDGVPPDVSALDNIWTTNADWVIEPGDDIYHENKTILVMGNLYVNGTLTLVNVNLQMGNASENGSYNISVLDNGKLTIRDYDDDYNTVSDRSIINSTSGFRFAIKAWPGARLDLKNSEIRDCGWDIGFLDTMGIFVYSDWVNITGNYIHDSMSGVCIYDCNNVTVANNTLSNLEGFGVYTHYAEDCYLINNTVTTTGSYGFMLYSSYYLNLSYNDISAGTTIHGILARGGGGHEIYNNTITNNDFGIFLYADALSESTIVFDINDNKICNNDYGIYIRGFNGVSAVQYIDIYGNDIYSNNFDGIFISGEDDVSAATDIYIVGNNIYSNNENGIYIQGTGGPYAVNYVYIYYNIIYDNGAGGGDGIQLLVNSFGDVGYIFCRYNEIYDNIDSGYHLYGVSDIYIRDDYIARNDINLEVRSSDYIFVTNTTIEKGSPISDTDIELDKPLSSYPPSVYLLNTTFDKSEAYVSGSGSLLNVRWYLHVRVMQQGLGVDDANVWINNSQNDPEPSMGQPLNTGFGNDGWIRWIPVTEFNRTSGGTTYYTDHNIDAQKGQATGFAVATMDTSKEVIIYLDTLPTADNFSSTATSVYRGNTIYFNANGSDVEDNEDKLTPHFEYRAPSGSWTTVYLGAPTYIGTEPTGFWQVSFTPPANAPIGSYDFRVRFNDTATYYSNYIENLSMMQVLNNIPIVDAGPDESATAGLPYTFNGSGSTDYEDPGDLTYEWDIDDSDGVNFLAPDYTGIYPEHTYNTTGVYIATLWVTDQDGDMDIDTVQITVIDDLPPSTNFTTNIFGIVGSPHDFDASDSKDNVGIISYNWDFGDGNYDNGTNITTNHTYSSAGKYNVTLNCSDAEGLWSTFKIIVTINPSAPPESDPNGPYFVNEDTLIILNGSNSKDDLNDIVNYTWDIDVSDGVDFDDPSLWGVEVSWTYNTPGIYTVTLNVTDGDGAWHHNTTTVMVYDITNPVANAGLDDTINEDTPYQFDGTLSSDNSGSIAYYNWSFGDGFYDNGSNPTPIHTYDIPSIYTVILNVTDFGGNWNETSIVITVNDITKPVVDAGSDATIDEGTPHMFDGSGSYDPEGGSITWYNWSFGDGFYDNGLNLTPIHTYDIPSIYIVTLNVTDLAGNWNETSITITVKDITKPVVDAGSDATIDEDTLHMFDGSGSYDPEGGSISWYNWSFGDGFFDNDFHPTPTHTYDTPGIYTVTLRVTDLAGNWNETSITITVKDITPPVANAGPDDSVYNGTAYGFDGSGSYDNVGIVWFNWSFGDGNYDNGSNQFPIHLYGAPGNYVVKLTVTDAAGNSDTDIMNITVIDITKPIANAGPDDNVNEDFPYTFDGSNSVDDVGIVTYAWDMDDKDGVDWVTPDRLDVAPTYTYTEPGIYTVTLNVTDEDGNWDTDTVIITVNDITKPISNAGPNDQVNEDSPYNFDGSGSSDNVGIVSYLWDMDDTDGLNWITPDRTGVSPAYIYSEPGWYTITLNVSDEAGNWALDTLLIEVLDITSPTAVAGSNDNVNEDTFYIFDGSGSSDNVGITNYAWDMDADDGVLWNYNGTNLWDPSHTYPEPGDYTVTLKVTDAAGNSNTDTIVITVNDVTSPIADAGNDATINEGVSHLFNATASTDNVGITYYAWDMNESDGIDWVNPDYSGPDKVYALHKFTKPGIYPVTLNVTDGAGNSHTDFVVITVLDITSPTADAGPDDSINEDTPYSFNASGSYDNVGIVNYAWDIDDDDGIDWDSPDYFGPNMWDPVHTYKEPGIYTVTLNVTDAQGNWGVDSLIIQIYDITPPELDVQFEDIMDEDTEYEFNASSSWDDGGIAKYEFTFGDGYYIAGTYSVVSHTYENPGIYTVTVNITDKAGNWNTTSWLVRVRDTTPPLTPAGLKVSRVPEGSALNITWLPNTEDDLHHYELYCSDDGVSYRKLEDLSANATSYLHSDLVNGVKYDYYIVAIDNSGLRSNKSNIASGVPDRDSDRDELYDSEDDDDDNDGVTDDLDVFPDNPFESSDNDGDGIGDNADLDDDEDGHLDDEDAFPFDKTEYLDTDGDGIGNNADDDDDGDGVKDSEDAYPLDSSRSEEPINFMTMMFLIIALICLALTIILAILLSMKRSDNRELTDRIDELEEEKAKAEQMQLAAAPVITERPRPPAAVRRPPIRPPSRPPARKAVTPPPKVITEEEPKPPTQPPAEAPEAPPDQPPEQPAPPTIPPPKPGEMPPHPGETQEEMPPPPPAPAPEELPPPKPEEKPKPPEPEE